VVVVDLIFVIWLFIEYPSRWLLEGPARRLWLARGVHLRLLTRVAVLNGKGPVASGSTLPLFNKERREKREIFELFYTTHIR